MFHVKSGIELIFLFHFKSPQRHVERNQKLKAQVISRQRSRNQKNARTSVMFSGYFMQ